MVVVEGKTSLILILSAQITRQGFMKDNYNSDNCYNTLRGYYLVHLAELDLYGKLVNINNIFLPNDQHRKNIKNY